MKKIKQIIVLAVIFAVLSTSAFANLIVNGDFETLANQQGMVNNRNLNTLASGQWDVFTSLPGWSTTVGHGIELQFNAVATGTGRYVELDSHPWGGSQSSTTNSNIWQKVDNLIADQWYTLQFDYWNRTGTGSSVINVTLGDFSYNTDSLAKSWVTITKTFMFTGDNTLTFLATGAADQLGGFIDNVSLKAVPLPAAVWMLGAGLVALVGVRRRMPS